MTETAVPTSRTTADLARPEERGTLEVRSGVVARVAERSSLGVEGTVRHSSTLDRLRGSGAPHASVDLHGHLATVTLDVAVAWPAPVAQIARQVRDTVLAETARLTGVDVRTVDVTVHVVPDEPDSSGTRTRRRVE